MRIALVFAISVTFPLLSYSKNLYVPGEYSTIQKAIDVAVDGDLVLVSPGTYVENFDFLGKAITVRGEYGPYVTVIDGKDPAALSVVFRGCQVIADGINRQAARKLGRVNCKRVRDRKLTLFKPNHRRSVMPEIEYNLILARQFVGHRNGLSQ